MLDRKVSKLVLTVLGAGLLASHIVLWLRVNAQANQAHPTSPPPVPQAPVDLEAGAAESQTEPKAAPAAPPELAPYMVQLQGLTHKLGLAIAAGDSELVRFYLYESRGQVSEILDAVPEYRGHPVALLAERFLDGPYERLATAVDAGADVERLSTDYRALVSACNGCHHATRHGFIRIPRSLPTGNPYLQRFAPEPTDGLAASARR